VAIAVLFAQRILMALVDLWFMLIPRRRPSRQALADCKIISHRGEHDNRRVFENTLAAFLRAAEAGCWGLELDVRWTRDLQPVVVHDDNLQRVFGLDLAVAQVDLQELQQCCPGVPTLAQVVERFGGQQHLMVELKRDRLGDYEIRAERLREIFCRLEPTRDYHFLALQLEQFELAEFCGRRACLPVAEFNIGEFSRLALEQGYAGVCAHYLMLGAKRIRRHHQHQQKLGTGFAASRYGLYREINRGVDWIFTNHALRLESIRRQHMRD
jgi:glycerophosphoryl diester phosphodiesterase